MIGEKRMKIFKICNFQVLCHHLYHIWPLIVVIVMTEHDEKSEKNEETGEKEEKKNWRKQHTSTGGKKAHLSRAVFIRLEEAEACCIRKQMSSKQSNGEQQM